MKTIHLMTVSLASLLMASCSQNEVTEVSPDAHPQMTFAAYTGTSTRGTDTTNESMKAAPSTEQSDSYGGFGVMGYHTGTSNWETAKLTATPGFMHNQLVKWDATSGSGKWTYSPVKYWPNNLNDKISFFAYAPYESSWSDGANVGVTVSAANVQGIPYIDFKL
ncbi:fimbrillin family protein, partial [Bacteroides sp. GD17]|uniref:fimbrillin family protein n=1 Tax=Bacteroides sp. GD17 TaxID=3139826 RepID=UPI00313DBD9B